MNHTVKIITLSLCILSLGTTHSMELSKKKLIGTAFIGLAILGGAPTPTKAQCQLTTYRNISDYLDFPASAFDLQNLQQAQQVFEVCQDRGQNLCNPFSQLYNYFFPSDEPDGFSYEFMSKERADGKSRKTGKCFIYQVNCLVDHNTNQINFPTAYGCQMQKIDYQVEIQIKEPKKKNKKNNSYRRKH